MTQPQISIVKGTGGQSWIDLWESKSYVRTKRTQWEAVNNYLNQPVNTSIEIGCGTAMDSIWFQERYNSTCYLIEGCADDNTETQERGGKFGDTETMRFYHTREELYNHWNGKLEYTHWTPEEAHNATIEPVDLIFSFKSCGAHYPMSAYTDMIRKHSNKNTRLIFDLRIGQNHMNDIGIDYEIVDIVAHSIKHKTVELRLI